MRRVLFALCVLLVVAITGAMTVLPRWVDADRNRVVPQDSVPITDAARALHARLRIADMHNDLLLWSLRDPLLRHERGHSDIPRLIEGNVAVQLFSTVSKTARELAYSGMDGGTDNITLLAVLQHWPIATWTSLYARAVRSARALDATAARSAGMLAVVRTSADLARGLAARSQGTQRVLGVLSLEGLHVLEGRAENLDSLYALGYRMAGLTHFFDNEIGGSAHGLSGAGLTPLGRGVVQRMEQLGMLVDLAHASPQLFADVMDVATKPVVVSHTGVQAICPGPRNLTDAQLERIGASGGVVGIGYWDGALCDLDLHSLTRSIVHAVRIAGEDHVALGSDWDGAVTTGFDASQLVVVTNALLEVGLPASVIEKVMGENLLRVLSQALPPA